MVVVVVALGFTSGAVRTASADLWGLRERIVGLAAERESVDYAAINVVMVEAAAASNRTTHEKGKPVPR